MDTSDRLTVEYLDRCKRIKTNVLKTIRFDEHSDLSMTYLGRSSMVVITKKVAEERFPNVRTMVYKRQAIRQY